MKTIQKIAFVLASVFLVYQTYALMATLITGQGQEFPWFMAFLFAFLLNLFATGVFAFVGFGFATSRLLPKNYYVISNPPGLKQCYRFWGVEAFRKALMITFWGKEKNRRKYFDGTRRGIRNFVYQTKQSEFGHLAALLVITVLSLVLAFHGYEMIAVIASVINLIGNLYPILLQRHHRMRLGKLAERF